MSKVPLDNFKFPRRFLVDQISVWGRAPTSYLLTISPQVVLWAQRPLTYLHQVFSPQRIFRNAVQALVYHRGRELRQMHRRSMAESLQHCSKWGTNSFAARGLYTAWFCYSDFNTFVVVLLRKIKNGIFHAALYDVSRFKIVEVGVYDETLDDVRHGKNAHTRISRYSDKNGSVFS